MFGKFTANLKRKGRGSHGSKFRLEVQVVQVKGLPSAVKKCRLVWSRSAKVQMTDVKDVKLSGKSLLCGRCTQLIINHLTRPIFPPVNSGSAAFVRIVRRHCNLQADAGAGGHHFSGQDWCFGREGASPHVHVAHPHTCAPLPLGCCLDLAQGAGIIYALMCTSMQDYEFKVQVPGRNSEDAAVTVGKANLDMSKFCGEQNETRNHLLPITVKVGSTTYPKVYAELIITSVFLADANEDSLTDVSGMTGLTSHQGSVREQDLEGASQPQACSRLPQARALHVCPQWMPALFPPVH